MHSLLLDRNALAAGILLALAATPALAEEPATTPAAEAGGGGDIPGSRPARGTQLDIQFRCQLRAPSVLPIRSTRTRSLSNRPGDLSDNWSEASIKPALSAEYTTSSSSQIYGKFSAVGDAHLWRGADDWWATTLPRSTSRMLYIGWRSGNSLGDLGENVLDFTVGRTQYKLGHGMLLCDGSARTAVRGAVTGPARARPSSLPRSAASSPAITPSRRSTSTRTTCRRPTPTASSGARTTSTRSARTRRSAPRT